MVCEKKCDNRLPRSARVLAGKCVAKSLPARTRALRLGATERH